MVTHPTPQGKVDGDTWMGKRLTPRTGAMAATFC